MSIKPTYFERDRYDLPLPLIGLNPNTIARETTLIQSVSSNSASAQQRLIFQALTQVLTPIGVLFKFSVEHHPQSPAATADSEQTILQSVQIPPLKYRLWVRCHAQKSLDCQILAEPLAKVLRGIDLQEFQTAIVEFSRFSGGTATKSAYRVPDWRLKIDLTPPTVRLRNWARWGDVQSISKLLNLALADKEIQVSAALKDLTLQLFCTLTNPRTAKSPSKKIVVDTIAPLLISFAPQGIQGATIHGVLSGRQVDTSRAWIHWLDLPGLGNPQFSPTPIILAARGDQDALNFILERLLNPDLEQCFAIGGIHLSLLRRQHLIHVMSESPICPIQSQVTTTVVKVIKQLAWPEIRGVRIHGRIAGQSTTQWTYGVDFSQAPLELPPVAVEHQFVVEPLLPKIGWSERISKYLVGTGIWKHQFRSLGNNQLVYEPRFRWERSLLLLLVGLGFVIASDLMIGSGLTPNQLASESSEKTVQLSFNNYLLEQKLAQYQNICTQQGVPDILIVGSSRALRGVDPAVFRTKSNLQVYNFGINGATAQVVDLILRQLLKSEQLPKTVIWADGSRAFNSGRIDRTYETIASSSGYRKLARTAGFNHSNSPLLQAQSFFQNAYQDVATAIDLQLSEISPAYHYRDQLKDLVRTSLPVMAQLADGDNSNSSYDPAASINDRDVNADGFLPLKLQFDPSSYYQKYAKITGDSDGDYADFQLQDHQDIALHQTIDLLKSNRISLVFVNLPLSDIYLDKYRRQYEIIFKQYMQKMMDSNQLTFIDMDGLLNTRYDHFSDPSHLNQAGAVAVSEYLTQTKAIQLNTKR
ncbi:MAG: DUF1574 family protein [Chamaesiphon sp.]|nr:DUF1574 family protein [Chamaesiphon sp.]